MAKFEVTLSTKSGFSKVTIEAATNGRARMIAKELYPQASIGTIVKK